MSTLCGQLLLKFNTTFFKTLQNRQFLSSLSEDVHVVRYNSHDYFCHYLHDLNLYILDPQFCTIVFSNFATFSGSRYIFSEFVF